MFQTQTLNPNEKLLGFSSPYQLRHRLGATIELSSDGPGESHTHTHIQRDFNPTTSITSRLTTYLCETQWSHRKNLLMFRSKQLTMKFNL